MKNHTDAYFKWSESDLEFFQHIEWVTDDREIDVRVRKNEFDDIQIFNGVYDRGGKVHLEEYIVDLDFPSLESAKAWGIDRTKSFSGQPSKDG